MPNNPDVFLSFDFGLRRIGVAVGQAITGSATPLDTLLADNGQPNWQQVTQLLDNWRPAALIVGLPYTMAGGEQKISTAAREFAQALKQRFDLPVHKVDERLTSREAKRQLDLLGGKGKALPSLDSYSAKLILEAWFSDRHCR